MKRIYTKRNDAHQRLIKPMFVLKTEQSTSIVTKAKSLSKSSRFFFVNPSAFNARSALQFKLAHEKKSALPPEFKALSPGNSFVNRYNRARIRCFTLTLYITIDNTVSLHQREAKKKKEIAKLLLLLRCKPSGARSIGSDGCYYYYIYTYILLLLLLIFLRL